MNRGEIRPFSKPWKPVDHEESFEVTDSTGRSVYFSDDANRRNFMRRLSKDDARRMAQQILWLPEFVRSQETSIPTRPNDAAERGGIVMLADIAMRRALYHGGAKPEAPPRKKRAKSYRLIR